MDTQTTKELLNAPQRGEIILYQTADGRTKIDVKLENETVWLTQDQLVILFERDRSVISRHISNIFKEGELDPNVVCAKIATTTPHGAIPGKWQTHEVVFYNLDVIITELISSYSLIQFSGCKGTEDIHATTSCA